MATKKPHLEALEADTLVEHVTPADGNIFLDIGFPPAKAERLLVHADLSITIREIIRTRRLTRARAAALFGVTQTRVSEFRAGKHDQFTIDGLVEMLGHAGYRVRVRVEQAPDAQPPEPRPTKARSPRRQAAKARPARARPARAR